MSVNWFIQCQQIHAKYVNEHILINLVIENVI